MPEIPDEMNLHWIAKFLGESPKAIYELNKAGLGPKAVKRKGQYIVTKKAFLIWLATGFQGGNN